MSILRYVMVACLTLMVFSKAAHAAGYVDNLDVRPDIGYGYAASKDGKRGMGYHAGVRILSAVRSISNPTPDKRWGLEISSVAPFESKGALKHEKYTAVGIVLEQVLPARIVATIGTIGYRGVDQNKSNPFGVIYGFAWEPQITGKMRFSAGLRAETIYDTSTISRYSLTAGLTFTVF